MDVQALDAKLDQIRHQLATMPETTELETLSKSRSEAGDLLRDAQIRVEDLTRDQKKADADVEQVKTRRKRDQDRIDQGLVGNPKDLERMQHELVSLERRINELEDVELEVMEQLETAQRDVTDLTAQVTDLDDRVATTTRARDEKAEKLTAEGRALTGDRKQTAAGLPEDLMALYTKLREKKDGVGAAALRARRCGGCQLDVNAADRGRIASAPADEVIRCEECGRILVRTGESGI